MGPRPAAIGTPGNYQSIRLSPDGGRVLFDRKQARIGTPDLWVLDLVRGGETRLTSDVTSESWPVWLRDGLGVVFMADRAGPPHLFRRNARHGRRGRIAASRTTPTGRPMYRQTGRRWPSRKGRPLGNYDILTSFP